MKKIDVGQTITILANVGVLVGLALVSIQIRQNTEITKAQLANDYFLADMQLELSMMGDDPIVSFVKAVYTPDQVTERDAAVLDRYFNYGLVQVLRLSKMRELGLADDEMVERQVAYLKWHLGNEVGRKWWANYERSNDNALTREISSALRDSRFRQNKRFLDPMLPAEPIREQE